MKSVSPQQIPQAVLALLMLAFLVAACSAGDEAGDGSDANADPAAGVDGPGSDGTVGQRDSSGTDAGGTDAGDANLSSGSLSPNGGILDDRQCGPAVDDVLFFGRGDDLTALSSTGEVLWTVPGAAVVEQDPQGLDWVILRNGEVFNFDTGSVVRNGDLTKLGGALPDCRLVYLVPPHGLVGHDGNFAWQVDESIDVPGSYQGSDGGVLVFGSEVDADEDFAPDGVPVDNLMGLADDGSVVWSRTAKGSLRYANGAIGIGEDDGPTVWFDGATGDELFSTDKKFTQVIECGTTLWFHVRGDDGFGLEVRDAQTGEMLYQNDQVLRAAAGYDGYGDEAYYAQGTSAGFQIDDQFTFVPDCAKPDEPAWTATATFIDDIIIVGDVVYSPQSRTAIDRASGKILIERTDEYGFYSTPDAIVAVAERDGGFGLAFFAPRTFAEMAFIPGPEGLSALRVPSWADPAVLRLGLLDGTNMVVDARTGDILAEFE